MFIYVSPSESRFLSRNRPGQTYKKNSSALEVAFYCLICGQRSLRFFFASSDDSLARVNWFSS